MSKNQIFIYVILFSVVISALTVEGRKKNFKKSSQTTTISSSTTEFDYGDENDEQESSGASDPNDTYFNTNKPLVQKQHDNTTDFSKMNNITNKQRIAQNNEENTKLESTTNSQQVQSTSSSSKQINTDGEIITTIKKTEINKHHKEDIDIKHDSTTESQQIPSNSNSTLQEKSEEDNITKTQITEPNTNLTEINTNYDSETEIPQIDIIDNNNSTEMEKPTSEISKNLTVENNVPKASAGFNLNYLYFLFLLLPIAGIIIGATIYFRRKKSNNHEVVRTHNRRYDPPVRTSTLSWVFKAPECTEAEAESLKNKEN